MDRDDIEDIVQEIMVHDGPDSHVDGSELITDFIMALLAGTGEAWFNAYILDVAERGVGRGGCLHK